MLRYSIKRILLALLTVLIIAAITFFAMNAIPGGPFSSEKAIDPATLAALEARYGLDKPLGEQFVNYLRNLLQGDLGVSLKTGREISDVIGESFGVSARLGLMAALIAVVAGLVLGSIAALCRGKWPDRIIIFITTLFVSVPSFVLAYSRIRPFESRSIDGYSVTALEAVHYIDPNSKRYPIESADGKTFYRTEEALFYLIEKDGKSILYAHDTDEFTSRDMEFLAGRKINLISMDCTNGTWDCEYYGHMGANDNLRMREKLLANGAADEHTVFVANHFSHNGLVPYEEMQKRLPGFIISYDGLELNV